MVEGGSGSSGGDGRMGADAWLHESWPLCISASQDLAGRTMGKSNLEGPDVAAHFEQLLVVLEDKLLDVAEGAVVLDHLHHGHIHSTSAFAAFSQRPSGWPARTAGPGFTQLGWHGCDLCGGRDAVFEPVKSSYRASSASSFAMLLNKKKTKNMVGSTRRTWQAIGILGAFVCVCVRINGGIYYGAHVSLD